MVCILRISDDEVVQIPAADRNEKLRLHPNTILDIIPDSLRKRVSEHVGWYLSTVVQKVIDELRHEAMSYRQPPKWWSEVTASVTGYTSIATGKVIIAPQEAKKSTSHSSFGAYTPTSPLDLEMTDCVCWQQADFAKYMHVDCRGCGLSLIHI